MILVNIWIKIKEKRSKKKNCVTKYLRTLEFNASLVKNIGKIFIKEKPT